MDKSPRPILKRSSPSSNSAEKQSVHFPPSPALTRTFAAHSPAHYDRSPIVVGPNICALPERGGRTYVLEDKSSLPSSRKASSKSGRLLHPRAMMNSPATISSLPSLIPDLSSESDESDGFPSPHLEKPEFFLAPANQHGLKAPDDATNLLAFLPYAPSNPYLRPSEEEVYPGGPTRRKERRPEASRRKSSSSSRPRSSAPSAQYSSSFALGDSFSSLTLRDDGCLGGF